MKYTWRDVNELKYTLEGILFDMGGAMVHPPFDKDLKDKFTIEVEPVAVSDVTNPLGASVDVWGWSVQFSRTEFNVQLKTGNRATELEAWEAVREAVQYFYKEHIDASKHGSTR